MELILKHVILWSMVLVGLVSRRWSLPVLAFALPLSQWFPDLPVPGLNALNLFLLPVFARALAAGSESGKRPSLDPIIPTATVFLVFVAISWARVQFADDLPSRFLETDGIYANFVTLKEFVLFVALYFCGRRLTRDPEDLRLVVTSLFAVFVFESLTAAKEFLLGETWRATGHLGHPNKLGAFLSGYIMLPIGFLLGGAGNLFMPVVASVIAGGLGLLGAVSRAALLTCGGAVVLLAAIKRSPWIIVFAAVVGTAPIWLPEKVASRFDSSFEEDESTGDIVLATEKEGRVQIWQCAILMIRDQPMFGVGLRQFPYRLREYGYTHHNLKSSHNIFLQLSAEQGVPCAVAHVVMMVTLLAIALRVGSRFGATFAGNLGYGFAGCVIAFQISSMFGDSFYENNLSGVFWILGGIIVNIYRGYGVPALRGDGSEVYSGKSESTRWPRGKSVGSEFRRFRRR